VKTVKRKFKKKRKPKSKLRSLILFLLILLEVIVFISYREIRIHRGCTKVNDLVQKSIPKEEFSDVRSKMYCLEENSFVNHYYYACSVKNRGIIETSKYYYKKLKLKLGEKIKKEKVITLDITDKIKISNCNIQNRTIIREGSEFIVALGGEKDDLGFSVKQTSDGGYIMVGFTSSCGEGLNDGLIARFDKSGNLEWAKIVGGDKREYSYSVKQTKDQGYVVAGITTSYGAGATDSIILKYDKFGNLEWTRIFGEIGHDYITSIDQTKNNGYIATGYTKSYGSSGGWDYFLAKFDEFGGLEWAKVTGGERNDCALAVKETIDNQYIVAGCSKSYSHKDKEVKAQFDILLIKYDQAGNVLWNKAVGGKDNDYTFSIQQTQDRGYIISGYTLSVDGTNKLSTFLYKYTESGELSWAKTIANEKVYSVQETQDKAYIIAGSTMGYKGDNRDVLFIKTKPNKSSIGNIVAPKISNPSVDNRTADLSLTASQIISQ